MSDRPSETPKPTREARRDVAHKRADGGLDVQDPRWIVRMTRAAFMLSAIAHVAYIANNYIFLGPLLGSAMLPFGLFALCASLASTAISFAPGYVRYWKHVTLAFCLSLIASWTIPVILAGAQVTSVNQQVQLFFALIALLVATCVLCPWDIAWEAVLVGAALVSAATNSAMVRPANPAIGYLWMDLLLVAGFTLASNRMWGRWRKALQQSEAKLRKIFDASPDTICINSMVDGRFIELNSQFSTTGYSAEETISVPAHTHGIWADGHQYRHFAKLLQTRGTVHNFEADFRQKDGSIVPCFISGATVVIDGEPCVVSVTSDIRRLKRAEAELIAAREAALAASQAKSEFLSSMSHEIRTPMNAILGMADLLAETNLTDEQRRFVETMVNNGNALLDLINGILDLAKVESGRLHLEETDFDLADLVELVTETFGVRAHEKGLELLFRILPEVPTSLVGDPLRLRQILVNLLGNAIKFTEHGEVVLTVENDTDANGLVALRFSVRDTGIGIPEDQIDSVFQSFTQADSSTTRRFGGSGLGLAIARRLVELMNGRIWVESEAGRGSTFYFTACFRIGQSVRSTVQPLDLNGVRVMVVDDNATNRLILREILTRRGAQIHEAAGGKEALTEVERACNLGEPYRLVLLDCRMPGMDGFQVAEQLKREPCGSQPTILMLTSDDMSHKLGRVRELGIDAYVVKPIKRSDLFRAIASAMGRAKTIQPTSATMPASAHADGTRPLKILLVEDSPDNRLLIEAYLKNFPYALDVAENGAVALEKFVHNPYDLILMDVQMPVMDGLTATRRIREWEREHGRTSTPVVALTASALEENVRQSMEAGCTAHVNKPVKKTSLLDVIHDLTNGSGATHSNGHEATEHLV
jgi:two-component system, sensor histidine kinase and response regulator